MAHRVKKGIDMPICYPRLVQTGLHQTDFPTLGWFETDRLRMGGVVRHTQHTVGTPLLVFPGCVGYCAWGARSTPRKPALPTHIWEWRNGCLSLYTLRSSGYDTRMNL